MTEKARLVSFMRLVNKKQPFLKRNFFLPKVLKRQSVNKARLVSFTKLVYKKKALLEKEIFNRKCLRDDQ